MVLTFLRPNLRIAVYAACLFCVVLGLKWATFDRFGSAMPDWDQWDAEAYYAIIPWFEHDHFLQNIFTPHNEHRVVLTKLQNLALTVLNGQWDARLQAVTNAILHSALATALWLLAVRLVAPSPRLPLSPSPLLPPRRSSPLPASTPTRRLRAAAAFPRAPASSATTLRKPPSSARGSSTPPPMPASSA